MAVSKKFRWTNKNGESVEVDIGADGANIDVDGKSLPEILEDIKNTSGNIITESNDINTEPSAIHLSKIPIEGMYYLIPPQGGGADNTWDSISWDNGSAYFSDGNINGEEAAIIRYCGGVGENAFEIIAKFNIHDHENKEVLDGITADRVNAWDNNATKLNYFLGSGSTPEYTTLQEIEDGINSAKAPQLYNATTPIQIGTWIDGTPIWRLAFDVDLPEDDIAWSDKNYVPDYKTKNSSNIRKINAKAFVRAAVASSSDEECTVTIMGTFDMPPNATYDNGFRGVYGFVEFATPVSNIK